MSTWKPDSDLMRLNAAPPEVWVDVPERLLTVLSVALQSDGFRTGPSTSAWATRSLHGDSVRPRPIGANPRRAVGQSRPAHEVLEIDAGDRRVRKHAPLTLDLSGIAKGYGVDRLAEVVKPFGIPGALVGIDGELRALGLQPDGNAWTVAVECPDRLVRAPYAILALQDAAVATSGDYRHWVEVGGRRLSHTMDPRRGGPLAASPASVTVVAAPAWTPTPGRPR